MFFTAALLLGMMGMYPLVQQPPGFNVYPYALANQSGYEIVNISVYGKTTLPIGVPNITLVQNYITPNESGVSLNGRAYYLNLNKPVKVAGQNNIYVELVKVNYIPILDTVDFNIYKNTTGNTTSSLATTTAPTTTIPAALSTTTIPSTGVISSAVCKLPLIPAGCDWVSTATAADRCSGHIVCLANSSVTTSITALPNGAGANVQTQISSTINGFLSRIDSFFRSIFG
ncbi:hypothetical protein M1397_03400 [Candidatus Marsarchaeota archaeon]|nr:hypothetical protein [Candidatus Marsarchaeota archaeon]